MRAGVDLAGRACLVGTSWLFKFFRAANTIGFEEAPRLIREPIIFRARPGLRSVEAELKLASSATDPLGDVPVRGVIDAWYGTFDNTMLPGRTVRRVRNPLAFGRKALTRFDTFALLDKERVPPLRLRERARLRRQLRRF
jgi:hypothetical protein